MRMKKKQNKTFFCILVVFFVFVLMALTGCLEDSYKAKKEFLSNPSNYKSATLDWVITHESDLPTDETKRVFEIPMRIISKYGNEYSIRDNGQAATMYAITDYDSNLKSKLNDLAYTGEYFYAYCTCFRGNFYCYHVGY